MTAATRHPLGGGRPTDRPSALFRSCLPRATLAWNDPQAALAANKTLVNDLDLVVTHVNTNTVYYTWYLDPSCPYEKAFRPVATCLDLARWGDHRNNVEQVSVSAPPAGLWQITVLSSALAVAPQPYAIVIEAQ